MTKKSPLFQATPFEVEQALKKLGDDLRTARLRRNLSTTDAGAKIGAGRRAIVDAERGKPSTSMAVYAGLLWSYGFVDRLADAADPALDKEGQRQATIRERAHARRPKGLNNDF